MSQNSNAHSDAMVQLKVGNLYMAFGGVTALYGVSFEVKKGEIFSLIGPNGAGKTVTLNCVSGLYKPQKGTIYFEGQDIGKLKPYQRAELALPGRSRILSFSVT